MSTNSLAKKFGIAYSTLRNRVKAEKWPQDLTDQIRHATAARVDEANAEKSAKGRRKEGDTVDLVAKVRAEIVIYHQGIVEKLRGYLTRTLTQIGKSLEAVEKLPTEARGEMIQHATLTDRVNKMLRDAAGTANQIVPLERQAHNLSNEDKAAPEHGDVVIEDLVMPDNGRNSPIFED